MTVVLVMAVAVVVWFGVRGVLGPAAVVVAVGAAVLTIQRLGRAAWGPAPGLRLLGKVLAALYVALLFTVELVLSNLQQIRVVFGPARLVQPHWLSFRTELERPSLRALLGMMISLTPGTMTVDLEEDGTVWVHVLVAEDDDAVVARLRRVLEAPLRRLEA